MSVNKILANGYKHVNIEKMVDREKEYALMHHSYPNVLYMNELIKHCKRTNQELMKIVNYYKIGKHGKIEELNDFDRENIDKFPEDSIFYEKFPEEAIKLDI